MPKGALSIKEPALAEIFREGAFKGKALFNEPMNKHTSLKVGGPADVFAAPADSASLKHLLGSAAKAGIPVTPIGSGTNVLVGDDGIRGIVLSLSEFKSIMPEGATSLFADAGVSLGALVAHAGKHGLSGIEALSGIPGTVGGAVAGNAGAYGVEIKDVLFDISVIDLTGTIKVIDARDMEFAYRKAILPQGAVILSASFRLGKDSPQVIAKRAAECLRQKKATQPLGKPSAGCFFKNPPGGLAGRLIDEAGCKGMRAGGAEVSSVHANFLINRGNATASDFLALMEKVADKVRKRSGVTLEPEVRILG